MQPTSIVLVPLGSLALVAAGAVGSSIEDATRELEPVRYDRDVRPILADRCFSCHGADANKRQAKLRLDEAESALAERDGGPALVAGKPDESELWRRVTSDDSDERMPPASSHKRALGANERELVRRWIEQGARYETHWSFVPPTRPALPDVRDATWPRNEVDRFVLAKLESEGIAPSPEADRETLLRRVFLDLTGLPPTPEELDDFLADERTDAYERWVDRLLTVEPYVTRYAERMAVPWLDASRYADTCGIHTDAGRTMWPWRDWVLDAFKTNMPFDRFVTEQLAGDLLPKATQAQLVASGFHRNHVTTDEGGAIPEEYLVEYAVDRAATTGSVFLGLTMGCARCHDHKYDPITQADFYSLYSFFASIDEPGLYDQQTDPKRAFEPFILVPTPEQERAMKALESKRAELEKERERPAPGEGAEFDRFLADLARDAGLEWAKASVTGVASKNGATIEALPDGSVRASGKNPDFDEHRVTLRTDATNLRLVSLEALLDATGNEKPKLGRYDNGNAVLSGITIDATSVVDPTKKQSVKLVWAWADHTQTDGDHAVTHALDAADRRGWAVGGHQKDGGRVALFLADAPFGFEGGTELDVRLVYESDYKQHVLRRTRLSFARIGDAALDKLPHASSGWYMVGPFPSANRTEPYTRTIGPERATTIDLKKNFGAGNQYWKSAYTYEDGRTNALPSGTSAIFLARMLYAPTARDLALSLGSDDGLIVHLDGKEVFRHEIDRGIGEDQDATTIALPRGEHLLVLEIVNTAGQAGFYYQAKERANELAGDLVAGLVSASARTTELTNRVKSAWRYALSPEVRRLTAAIRAVDDDVATLDAAIPRTMVMKELAKPRDVFVLSRGAYDKPDKTRKVARAVPAALGKLPDGAPADRRGLAQWLLAKENPLVARVEANRLWEIVFGAGIVRSSEDFGLQGEWPSHPELLDWLAVELRESGWDVRAMMKELVSSATYRQSSRVRADVAVRDPDDRWLASFPRKRLGAEAIRDQALYVAGLLVEKLGGPSVKPYQPDGLWEEVAMPASNTRVYERGKGDDLWRRSLYTYWKRASPPPSLATFDAPTRESCTIRRGVTNTPLQALVLWNDVQFVEAARELAERTLLAHADERERLVEMFRRCTGRAPDEDELARLATALAHFRERYADDLADAEKLVATGERPRAKQLDARELAAWTLVANAILALDATLTRS